MGLELVSEQKLDRIIAKTRIELQHDENPEEALMCKIVARAVLEELGIVKAGRKAWAIVTREAEPIYHVDGALVFDTLGHAKATWYRSHRDTRGRQVRRCMIIVEEQ